MITYTPDYPVRFFVAYDPVSGKIQQLTSGLLPPNPREAAVLAEILEPVEISHEVAMKYQVALDSVTHPPDAEYPVCRLIEAGQEIRDEHALIELKFRRVQELVATDQYVLPDRVEDPAQLKRWVDYRKALRELGKFQTGTEWLENWPVRPVS